MIHLLQYPKDFVGFLRDDTKNMGGNVPRRRQGLQNLVVYQDFKSYYKCDVVCANCHKKRTAKTFKWYRGVIKYLDAESAVKLGKVLYDE